MEHPASIVPAVSSGPRFGKALRFWLWLGFISFGGPSGQIALLHAELVEKRRWIAEDRFLAALNYCMILPGPEATQLAIYLGWLLHGPAGGWAAGLGFILPSAALLWGLSWLYAAHGTALAVAALFHGLKAAVLAIVAVALFRIARRTLQGWLPRLLAAAAFVALFFGKAPFPLVIAMAAAIGAAATLREKGKTPEVAPAIAFPPTPGPGMAAAARILALGAVLWLAPVAALGLWLGWHHTVVREGLFFAKAALVSFGGAYAVLPYVAQQAVAHYGWLAPGQMIDGLGLAESTPGPLIIVLQFVGFLAAWQAPGTLSPLLAATLGALVTTWMTFAPSFIAIFAGAPYIENLRLRRNRPLAGAVAAVTAAVVGVILNLAVWFAQGVLFPAKGFDAFAATLAAIALVLIGRCKWSPALVLLLCAAAGWGWARIIG